MNKLINEYKKSIESKKIAVIGLGVSNTPLIEFLCTSNKNITIFDKSNSQQLTETIEKFSHYNFKYSLGKNYLSNLKGFDIIFKTPGIRYDIPELVSEKARGAVITSEMELFFSLCPAKILAVTGSDGKTTTTSLIYQVIKEAGYKCFLGGNIGNPLIGELDKIDKNSIVVLELSSFQLHTMERSPNISVITNIAPNHLDIHKSYEEYIEAKKNIFKYQSNSDKLIINYDNNVTNKFISEAPAEVIYFSRLNELNYGAMVKNDTLYYKSKDGTENKIINKKDITLKGEHNIENILAVIASVSHLVNPEKIYTAIKNFKSIEHRIEFVRKLNGVSFYNDSIGSSPSRTIVSIKSFDQKVILIAGGYDKKISYTEMGIIIKDNVLQLFLIGQTAKSIEKAYLNELAKFNDAAKISIIHCLSLDEAVKKAYKCAHENDIILMSPASASFDMFKNFEERGKKFKNIVMEL